MNDKRFKTAFHVVDRRAGMVAEELPLLSVSQYRGVIPRSELMGDEGRAADLSNYKVCDPGDIVLNRMSAYNGAVGLANLRGVVSPDYLVMRPNVGYDGKYLTYLIRSSWFVSEMSRRVKGIGSIDSGAVRTPRIGASELGDIRVRLPCLSQQEVVADFLDRETAQIDAFIAKNEELISLVSERRAAVVAHAITKGLEAGIPMVQSGVAWIGESPPHWTVQRLASTVTLSRNGIWGTDPDGGADDIRCIRVADFDRPRQRVHDANRTLRKVTASEREGRVVRAGDLLLEKSGGGEKSPVGFAVLYDREELAVCSNFVARIVLAPGMEPRFWTHVHGTMYRLRLTERSLKQSTGIQNLDQAAYFNELAPVPPLNEQAAIADYLDQHSAKIDVALETARRAIDLARERRAALISAAVTGKIDMGVSK
mgnify:CR=1 FL=1